MSQRMETKDRGTFQVDKTWIIQNVGCIWKLTNGGYCKAGGQPITKKSDLTSVLPRGEDLTEALEWFADRGKIKPTTQKKIVLDPSGDIYFDDGTPITSMSDIMSFIPPGPMQEMALKLFVQKQLREESKNVASINSAIPKSKEQDAIEKLKADLGAKEAAADKDEEEEAEEEP